MNIAVIFAGGVGKRIRSKEMPKQFIEVFNKPIIIYTLEHFEFSEKIDAIVIACVEEYIDYLQSLLVKYRINKVKAIVPGGKTGQLSIYNGLVAASKISQEDSIVLIHDGVRPLINGSVISDCVDMTKKYGSAVTTIKQKETIAMVDESGKIVEIPERDKLLVARAPQCFYLDDIMKCHTQALAEGKTNFTDSCSLMRYYGKEIYTVLGPDENIKITTPDDYYSLRAILEAKENAQIYGLE